MEYADYLKTGTMPPVVLPDEREEERKRKLLASAGGSPEFLQSALNSARSQAGGGASAAQPSPAPSSTATMPPVAATPTMRSDAFPKPFSARDKDLAIGATSQPTMPPVRMGPQPGPENVPAPEIGGQGMPPVGLDLAKAAEAARSGGPSGTVQPDATKPNTTALPPVKIGPQQQRYADFSAQPRPELHGWKKALDAIGAVFPIGQEIEKAIPGSPQNYDAKLNQAALRAAKEQTIGKGQQEAEKEASLAQFNTPEKRRAYMEKNPDLFDDVSDFQKHDFILAGKFPQREPAPEKTTDKKVDEYVNDKGQRVLTFQRTDNSTYDKVGGQTQAKPAGHTSAFEAFAYGSPEEKKAAQDYIDLEKKSAARYKTPSEFDEKFRLFKEDPETYKAMFGDKAGAPDRATATRMLNYFDRRRREVNQDFTLDDGQKQEQLQDIENLAQPFMDVVQPGSRGGSEGRVTVTHPDGRTGTIPRSQLGAAKKKGYKEVTR
jgi:hypothetical protein